MLHNGLPLLLVGLASAANHDFVWTKGFSGKASDQKLTVAKGDTIKFTWAGSHNVYKMKGATEYGSCSFTGAVQEGTGTAGPVTVTIGSTDEYFACKVGSHCTSGQKLHVTVSAEKKAPAPGPVVTTTTASPAGSNTTKSSASASTIAAATVSAVAVVVGLLM